MGFLLMVAALVVYLAVGAAVIQAIDNHVREDLRKIGDDLPRLEPSSYVGLLLVWPVPVAIYGVACLFSREK